MRILYLYKHINEVRLVTTVLLYPTFTGFYVVTKTISSHLRKKLVSDTWMSLLVWVLIICIVYIKNYVKFWNVDVLGYLHRRLGAIVQTERGHMLYCVTCQLFQNTSLWWYPSLVVSLFWQWKCLLYSLTANISISSHVSMRKYILPVITDCVMVSTDPVWYYFPAWMLSKNRAMWSRQQQVQGPLCQKHSFRRAGYEICQ